MMEYDVVAKNLLLEKTCWNCDHAASLATRGFNEQSFIQNTGFSMDTVHEGAYMHDTLFMCHKHHKVLPIELSCGEWVEARE